MKEKLNLKFNKLTADLLHAVYPHHCLICEIETPHNQLSICPICESELYYSSFENYTNDSPLDKVFWGRVKIEHTFALLLFSSQNSTRTLLHHLKYKDRADLAEKMGELIGEKLREMPQFDSIDALIPVPLHPKKEFIRGYNQAERIAKGISEIIQKPLRTDVLKRAVFTDSQTKKNKLSRWENMQNRFLARNMNAQQLTHIALVDDVVTTGATLETCIRLLRQTNPDLKISIISLAFAQ